ncbi:MAG: hypothetical protein LBU65_17725 [Planctomycetaceae bacterium]|jgi:hypothetical protein|nr:hypothetical protein [Planctomycetaceae bacterium]
MPFLSFTNQEFLDQNAVRAYPLSEQATRKPVAAGDSSYRLPDNLLVACKIAITASPTDVDVTKFYVRKITPYGTGVSIVFAHGDTDIAQVTVKNDSQVNHTHLLNPLNDFHNLSGHVTIGSLAQCMETLGDFTFDLTGTNLDADCIQYSPQVVTSITVTSNGHKYPPIYGDINLVAGDNVTIAAAANDGRTTLTISRSMPETEDDCDCIKTISGIPPDASGNIDIKSDSACVDITASAATLTISENCCQPCCGCEELATIVEQFRLLQATAGDVDAYIQRLELQMQYLSTYVSTLSVQKKQDV